MICMCSRLDECLTFFFSASRGNYFSDVHASPGCYIPSPPFGKVIEEALQIVEKRSESQRRKAKTHPSERRVLKNSKER